MRTQQVGILGVTATMHQKARATTIWGFAEGIRIMSSSGFFLSSSEAGQLEAAREASLGGYSLLSHESSVSNLLTWPLKPKHDYLDELCSKGVERKVNPASHWCFQDEDFIGRLVAICKLCDTRCREVCTFERYLLGFTIMLNGWSATIPFEDPVDNSILYEDAPEQ